MSLKAWRHDTDFSSRDRKTRLARNTLSRLCLVHRLRNTGAISSRFGRDRSRPNRELIAQRSLAHVRGRGDELMPNNGSGDDKGAMRMAMMPMKLRWSSRWWLIRLCHLAFWLFWSAAILRRFGLCGSCGEELPAGSFCFQVDPTVVPLPAKKQSHKPKRRRIAALQKSQTAK